MVRISMATRFIRVSGILLLAAALCFLPPSISKAYAETLVTRVDFIRAIEKHTALGDTEYKLTLSPALLKDVESNLDGWVSEARSNAGMRSYSYSFNRFSGTLTLSDIEYRTAVRILQACRTGNTGDLAPREKQTLDKAISIVQSAPAEELERERYLHDTLCASVEYYTDEETYAEKDQAVGALLNGKADCDGYSEAFYLLCNLAGIPARFQHGDTFEKPDDYPEAKHMWNLVCIYDSWVMVDVTWDDADTAYDCVYLYYNIGTKRAADTHIWEKDILAVNWLTSAGIFMRPADLTEGYANDFPSIRTLVDDALITRKANRFAFTCAPEINPENEKDAISTWIYSTGVKDYYWEFGGHSAEIIVTGWYDEYRIVHNDTETLAYIEEMKLSHKTDFSIFFYGDYGISLFENDLTRFYLLEGEFGIENDQMFYNDESHRVSYSNVIFDDNFSVCRTEGEVLDYISELSRHHIDHFALCIPGNYGKSLLADNLAAYYLLEAQFGIESDDMVYYAKNQRFVYTNVRFAENFSICKDRDDIVSFINNMARYGITDFSIAVPGTYGASLFSNKLAGLTSVFNLSLLSNDRSLTYYQKSQTVHIKNAHYWPEYLSTSLTALDSFSRRVFKNQPRSVAIWTDGTYQWNENNFNQLTLSMYRQGVDTFRYILSPERVEFTIINYESNYCLVSTEDELMSYLRDCRSRSQYSFRVYCTESLYQNLSANQFERFFDLTSSVLKRGQSIRYQHDYCLISMDAVQYK